MRQAKHGGALPQTDQHQACPQGAGAGGCHAQPGHAHMPWAPRADQSPGQKGVGENHHSPGAHRREGITGAAEGRVPHEEHGHGRKGEGDPAQIRGRGMFHRRLRAQPAEKGRSAQKGEKGPADAEEPRAEEGLDGDPAGLFRVPGADGSGHQGGRAHPQGAEEGGHQVDHLAAQPHRRQGHCPQVPGQVGIRPVHHDVEQLLQGRGAGQLKDHPDGLRPWGARMDAGLPGNPQRAGGAFHIPMRHPLPSRLSRRGSRVCPKIVGQLLAVVLQRGEARQNWDTPGIHPTVRRKAPDTRRRPSLAPPCGDPPAATRSGRPPLWGRRSPASPFPQGGSGSAPPAGRGPCGS
jgi:hypothetical protein